MLVAVAVEVGIELGDRRGAERERRAGRRAQLARLDHLEHAVLQYLGVGGEVVERAPVQVGQHGVGHVAHAGLDRQQLPGQPALAHLVLEEVHDVLGDLARVLVGRGERGVAVGGVRLDHGDHLCRVHVQVRLADPVTGSRQQDRRAVRRKLGAVVDVVHPLQGGVLPGVHLEDHRVGLVEPRLVVAHGGGGDDPAVLEDARHLDDGDVELAEEAEPDELGDVGEMDVDVLHLAGVDALPAGGVGLVGQAHLHAVDHGQRAVELGGGGGARPDPDPEVEPVQVRVHDPAGQCRRHCLRVARAGEAAHSDVDPGHDQRGGLLGRHDLRRKGGVEHAGGRGHGGLLSFVRGGGTSTSTSTVGARGAGAGWHIPRRRRGPPRCGESHTAAAPAGRTARAPSRDAGGRPDPAAGRPGRHGSAARRRPARPG